MKRFAINSLLAWKNKTPRKPIIVKGARQVGKTYLLEQFGQEHFPHYFYINFEKQPQFSRYFEKDLDPKRIITELSFALKQQIDIKNDLLILDEIQSAPKALTALKYFCEEMPELAICAAGSLIGIHLNQASFPVGKVDWLEMYPMCFEEFVMALDEPMLTTLLTKQTLTSHIPETAHEQLWELLKHYFIVGGLPEVVNIYKKNRETLYAAFEHVRTKQFDLLKDYYSDIAKHSGKVNAMHIDRTWTAIPTQLAHIQTGTLNRFKFKGVVAGIDRYRRLANVIDWLINAGLILKVNILDHCRQPLKAYVKESVFKLYVFDVGMLGAMSELAPETILQYDYGSYKGYFAENYVAQEFISADAKSLYCWQEKTAEVEFIKEIHGNTIPFEVKAGNSTHAKSLSMFKQKYDPPYQIIFSANKKSIQQNTYRFPLYLTRQLLEILKQ